MHKVSRAHRQVDRVDGPAQSVQRLHRGGQLHHRPAYPDAGPESEAVLADSVGVALLLVLDAFLTASREGRFGDLLALLDPNMTLHADDAAVATAKAAAAHGAPRSVFVFTVENGTVTEIDVVVDPDEIALLDVVFVVS